MTERQSLEELLLSKPDSIEQLIEQVDEEVYDALKLAVELGKWPDGKRIDEQQRGFCLQALILYEAKHLPEADRIGFDLSASCQSLQEQENIQNINIIADMKLEQGEGGSE